MLSLSGMFLSLLSTNYLGNLNSLSFISPSWGSFRTMVFVLLYVAGMSLMSLRRFPYSSIRLAAVVRANPSLIWKAMPTIIPS